MLEASARAPMRGAPCGLLAHCRAACGLLAHCRAPCGLLAHCRAPCGGAAQVRPCGVRRCSSSPSMRRCGVRHVTCESIRARHTVAPYWLTLVRRTRHSRTHAPCSQPRASCTRARMRMTATSCAASPTTWSLQPLCFTTRARSKIQRRLSSRRSAKCAIKAPHCASSRARARERVRVRVRVRVLRTLREDTSVCFHETIRMESSTLNTHLSSISPPMWDKVLLSL
ncbi:hypothetical protein HanXRQr2_Chr08g0322271 [Helianthus annuus]|uniref:Uncharacterized protein n=1 Tax=Helianthus annuus TaxID=4232 RepID=A0A9K3IBM1_HELAN|nr:hypothetical protein HanXRQr2_Chr08g0322271 [Helianthus annuus]